VRNLQSMKHKQEDKLMSVMMMKRQNHKSVEVLNLIQMINLSSVDIAQNNKSQ
jgi:hypothetical protein